GPYKFASPKIGSGLNQQKSNTSVSTNTRQPNEIPLPDSSWQGYFIFSAKETQNLHNPKSKAA
ncbi:MAG: hypothetical protein IKD37_09410, partial [Clostridia bacterium]|nr:hypothetical protein [Clostridia bacterium]